MMDVLMVIAAWGEGVGLSVSPSPSPDRSSLAKTRVKTLAGFFGRTPIRCARPRPRPAPNQEKGQKNCGVLTFSFSYTRVRQYSPIGI
jgi:hypothetical protein